ncbi:Vitellogenin-6 [Aphelenchoides besseyi]|nr:Vitellogenin-6 [Aphelenchoides besseyi]KAI6235353.1 Vitellogenin-6 [Aphelenchoides besseyi]
MPKSQRVQPFEHFASRDIPQELKQMLEMPLSVSYVDGVVERINFHEDDAAWSKNIKRAVLNMIQLNLKRNDVQGLKMQSSMPQEEQEKETPVFTIPEITLEGECETIYTVQKSPKYVEEDEQSTFNVTKAVNFDKCIRTADVSYGYQPNPTQQVRCLNCLRQQQNQRDAQIVESVRYTHCQLECQPNKPNDDNDLERSTVARYELAGKREKYAI